jgi:hypothetical protein
MQNDSSSTSEIGIRRLGNGEGSTSFRDPSVALIIIVLGSNLNLIGNEVSRVETNTKLTNHTDISTSRKGLHKGLGSRLGNGTEIVNQISLGHSDTGILNRKSIVGFVGDNLDIELWIGVKGVRVGQRLVTNLIQSITRVGNKFSKKDFLVGVKGVDNQRQKLVDIGRKGVAFRSGGSVVTLVGKDRRKKNTRK